jgi:hypothetical protein
MRTWRRRKEALPVFSLYAKRHKSVYICVNNNTNFIFLKVVGNEKLGGLKFLQLLGIDLGL